MTEHSGGDKTGTPGAAGAPVANPPAHTLAVHAADVGPRHAPLRTAWPAYLAAAGMVVYASMKATYAAQGKLGIPGGPPVPARAYAELGHVALRQWALSATGVVGAVLALATVRAWGRRVPRWLMLTVLWCALLPMAAGAAAVVMMVVTGPQSPATRIVDGVQALVSVGLWGATAWLYQRRSRVTQAARGRGTAGRSDRCVRAVQ